MKRRFFLFTPIALIFLAVAALAAGGDDEEWITVPAGGRPAYMGIQGGTMPVSLLVVGNGEALLTFVGRTGNDFLEVLKATDLPLPRLLNATSPQSVQLDPPPGHALFAGNAAASLPVIQLAGERLGAHLGKLQPFGLSDEPLRIEGAVERPTAPRTAKSYRLSFMPAFLQPQRNRR